MAEEPQKSRLDMVKAGVTGELPKRGRLLVGIEKVVEDPKNERKVFRNMEGIISSVKAVGIVEPLTVVAVEDGKAFQIVTGHRRFRAAQAAGLKTVEVIIREPEDERKTRRKSIVSNVQREDVGPVEMAEALQSLLEEDPEIKSQVALCELIGKTKSWVSQTVGILRLPPVLLRKVQTSELSIPYDAVSNIATLRDEALQKSLVEEVLKGANVRDIRARIKEHKGKGASSEATKPKQAFRTKQDAVVIVQSMTKKPLAKARVVAALAEALQQARKAR